MNFMKKRLVLLFVALAFAGCSPALRAAGKRAHLVTLHVYYVPSEQYKTIEFAPPPAPDSAAQNADRAVIMDWQAKRTEADCAKANETAKAGYDSFWGAKSPFPAPLPPEVKEFFRHVGSDLEDAVTNLKDRYRRPRPYAAYPGQAVPCIEKSRGYSYPSGHSTFSRVFASVLTDIMPERRDEFFAKADEIALDRVIGGVHFPSDIAAGKAFGDQFHAELLKSEVYREDIEKVKTFLIK